MSINKKLYKKCYYYKANIDFEKWFENLTIWEKVKLNWKYKKEYNDAWSYYLDNVFKI